MIDSNSLEYKIKSAMEKAFGRGGLEDALETPVVWTFDESTGILGIWIGEEGSEQIFVVNVVRRNP